MRIYASKRRVTRLTSTIVVGEGVRVVTGGVVEGTVGTRAGVVHTASAARRKSTTAACGDRRAAGRVARTIRASDGLIPCQCAIKKHSRKSELTHPEEMVQANASQLVSAEEISIPTL